MAMNSASDYVLAALSSDTGTKPTHRDKGQVRLQVFMTFMVDVMSIVYQFSPKYPPMDCIRCHLGERG